MAKVTVNLSDKTIKEVARKEILRLRLQVIRLTASNERLKTKIKKQNFKFDEANRIVTVASAITAEFDNEWGDS